FVYSSGRSSNEATFLMQVVARAWATPNFHNCSFYCHNASSVALGQVYGSGTASVGLDDLAAADLALVAGANPASNHPRLVAQLVALRRRGGRVIVVNPLRELGLVRFRVPSDWRSLLFGSSVSDVYLQPHVGADVAVFKALLKGVVEAGGVDRGFVAAHTSGWDAVEADLAATSWPVLVDACGVPRAEIDAAVAMLLGAQRGIAAWAMGLTHHAHGVDNVLALANLALARGWLGRPGAGLLPIRGHSNVQGVGSVGVTPQLKAAFAARMEEVYGIPMARTAGLAELLLPPGRFDWSAFRSHERLRQEMARIVPGYAPIGDIDRTRREFHVTGRVLHEPPFLTDDGKAHFHVTPIPAFAPPAGEFRLTTLRSE